MEKQRSSDGKIFAWIAWTALAIKLWVTSNIEVGSIDAPYDYTDFLRNAEQLLFGNWFGPYDNVTLIKGPGIELYLAFIREFGIPLPLAHVVVYAIACFIVVAAVRPLVRGGWWLGSIFCVLLFNPMTFDFDAWLLNRSQFITMASVSFVACGIGAIVRARRPVRDVAIWLVFFGLSAALVCLTREDTVWVYPAAAFFLVAYLFFSGAFAARMRGARSVLAALPVGVFVAALATVAAINGAVYGWNTTVEMTAPEFVSAYQSLSRIVVPGLDNRVYPAPAAARNMAYAASPAAAELKSHFDPGDVWKKISCSQLSLCDDVSAGWFVFAFRDAVAGAGYYTTGAKARAFYVRLSSEIDAACDAGRLKCRAKSLSLAPSLRLSDVPGTIRYAAEAVWHAAAYDQFALGGLPPYSVTGANDRLAYRNVTGSGGIASTIYSGWILHVRGGSAHVESTNATDYSTFEPLPSADVRYAFAASKEYGRDDLDDARFTITTSCTTGCTLVVDNGPGRIARFPLARGTTDGKAAGVAFHLDSVTDDPPAFAGHAHKIAAQTQIAVFYQQVIRWWVLLVLAVVGVRVFRAFRGKRPLRAIRTYALGGGAAFALLANCGVLGLVSSVSFYALYPEYETSLFPMLLIGVTVTTALEGEIILRLVRRRFRPRTGPVAATNRSPMKDVP